MNEISSCLGSLLCPDLGKFFPQLAVSWFLCRQFTCDFKPLATSQLHWMALCSPHHKLSLKLPVIQDSSCLETGVSCIFQTVPVWHSAFMKFLCMQAWRVCMWKYVSHVGVCRCTWVYTVKTWTYVCKTEVHLMYSTQSSHLFFFFTQGVSLKQKLVSLDRQTAQKTPPVLPHLWDPRCIMGNGSQWGSECRSPRFTSRALPTGPSPQPKVHVSFRWLFSGALWFAGSRHVTASLGGQQQVFLLAPSLLCCWLFTAAWKGPVAWVSSCVM